MDVTNNPFINPDSTLPPPLNSPKSPGEGGMAEEMGSPHLEHLRKHLVKDQTKNPEAKLPQTITDLFLEPPQVKEMELKKSVLAPEFDLPLNLNPLFTESLELDLPVDLPQVSETSELKRPTLATEYDEPMQFNLTNDNPKFKKKNT